MPDEIGRFGDQTHRGVTYGLKHGVTSASPHALNPRERLYIINSRSYSGIPIYTKGILRKESDGLQFNVMISSKRSEPS